MLLLGAMLVPIQLKGSDTALSLPTLAETFFSEGGALGPGILSEDGRAAATFELFLLILKCCLVLSSLLSTCRELAG